MQSILSGLLAILLSIAALFTGGKANVKLKLSEPVTEQSRYIRYELVNNTVLNVSAEGDYRLEKLENGEWTADWDTPGDTEFSWPDITFTVPAFGTLACAIDLERSSQPLTPGSYRLTKPYRTVFGASSAQLEFEVDVSGIASP